jgi:signal transduction histidine kinase
VLAAGLLFWFDRERMKRKEAIQKMRSNIADNLHSEVSTALNNINILSEMARLKADKDPEKSKEYIEQIHTRSHNMIIAMDDMLWSINPHNDSMAKTSDRMREYIDALKNRHGVNIEIAVDKKVESLELNMKLRHEASLVFKEGIKNLVTVGATDLHVYISLEKGQLLFTTQFNSEQINMQQLNNLLHRQDLEKRLKAMDATIDVQLHKSNSIITLEVPVT